MIKNSLDAKEVKGLSFEKCKEILNKNGKKYTEAEVEQIRQFLCQMAEIDYENYLNIKRRKSEEMKGKISNL
jgi:hypothetical protein